MRKQTNLAKIKQPYYRALPFWSAAVRPLPAGPHPLLNFPLQQTKKIRDSGNLSFPESLAFSCSIQQGKRGEKGSNKNAAHLSNLLTLLLFQKILYGLSDNLSLQNALRRTKQHFLNQEQQNFTGF